MNLSVEEKYPDVLQNIETAIVAVFEENSSLVDRDVLAAIDALISAYTRERAGREGAAPGPPGRAQVVYASCRHLCEWRLGRKPLNEGEATADDPKPGELSVSELILCLKRIRKSIRLWHSSGGRQGYLHYVSQFLGQAATELDD